MINDRLAKLAWASLGLLYLKIMLSILWEYRFYFPPDFKESFFLIGRTTYFYSWYQIAFYAHIITGPIVLLGATYLMLSGMLRSSKRKFTSWPTLERRLMKYHRAIGVWTGYLALTIMLPSGALMALKAQQGIVAGLSFIIQATFTAAALLAVAYTARRKLWRTHQQWATRTFLLLVSPLLLRLANGTLALIGQDSSTALQWTAWLTWVFPIATFELWLRFHETFRIETKNCKLKATCS